MKYRQYKIVHFSEIEDKKFGRAWRIQALAEGIHPDCTVSFMFSDLYSKAGFSEYFIAPYNNYVMDEIEDIALRGDVWSPDTNDWTVDKENTIVDGIPVITHHYCGRLQDKAQKPEDCSSRIASWMPLFQLIIAEKSDLKHNTDAETGIEYFECGKVKGFVSPSAMNELGNEVYSMGDFKVAMISFKETAPQPWLLYVPPKSKLATRNTSQQQSADTLLRIGEWRQAFPLAKRAMEKSMEEMGKTFKYDYNILKKDPEENPETGICFDRFVESNVQHFLPAIRNMLRVFDMAINDIDRCNAAVNYEDELEEIKQTVDKMVHDAKKPFEND